MPSALDHLHERANPYAQCRERIRSSGTVLAPDGTVCSIQEVIDDTEGAAIRQLIVEKGLSKTLEVGCGHGMSSLYICEALSALATPLHTIIDPFQSTEFKGVGRANLERCGCTFFKLIETGSEIALPELLAEGRVLDFILIDGFHTFDHAMLDFFYANRLLREGGFIAFDDAGWPSIRKALAYIMNYPNIQLTNVINKDVSTEGMTRSVFKLTIEGIFRTVARTLPPVYASRIFAAEVRNPKTVPFGSMVFLRKLGPDRRGTDWYEPF